MSISITCMYRKYLYLVDNLFLCLFFFVVCVNSKGRGGFFYEKGRSTPIDI